MNRTNGSIQNKYHTESDNNGTQPRWTIALHGGAGTISRKAGPEREAAYLKALEEALSVGRAILADGGTSLDAVEQTVRFLEDSPLFNAGRGASFNSAGVNEHDCCIMDGRNLATGATTGTTHVRNPISLARVVMEKTDHVLMAGEGAEAIARLHGLELVDRSYFRTEERWKMLQQMKEEEKVSTEAGEFSNKGTVGAVALDIHGNLAAATSTGGLTNKLPGRIGDTPIAGIGNYANNETCAISCTGHGEEFIRQTVAFRIASQMELAGKSLKDATHNVVMERLSKGSGGLVAVDRQGNAILSFNTRGMYRGVATSAGRFEVAIWE